MKVWKFVVLVLTVLSTGCATGTKMSSEQRASISSIAVTNSQIKTPLTVDYHQSDSSSVALTTGLFGLVAAHAIDAPKNRTKKLGALIKARAFNQLTGSFNSGSDLGHDLAIALELAGHQVRPVAQTVLKTEVTNCLSDDTKTLQVYTKYKLMDSSGDSLLENTALVQYTVEHAWTQDKLQKSRTFAVQETARLIASDIAGHLVHGEKLEMTVVQGNRVYSRDMTPIESPPGNQYLRMKGFSGYLISVAAETNDLRVRQFYGDAGNCL